MCERVQRKPCSSACLGAWCWPGSAVLSPCAQTPLAKALKRGCSSLLYHPRPRCQPGWWVSRKQDLIWDASWAAGLSFSWPWRRIMICVPRMPDLQRTLVSLLCLLLQLKQLYRLALYILETGTVVPRGRQNGCRGYLHISLFICGILGMGNVQCNATCTCINGACFQLQCTQQHTLSFFFTIVLVPGSGRCAAHSSEEWDFTAEPPEVALFSCLLLLHNKGWGV